MTDTNVDHDWALGRLMTYSLGLLPEDETLRLEGHLAGCEECRSRLAPVRARSATDAGHLPSSLIATWPRATRSLSGLERSLVESHVKTCAECRASLAFAGYEPVLSAEPAPAAARRVRHRTPSSAWGWVAGLVGAAAAAWLFLSQPVLFSHDPGHDPRTSATMGALPEHAADAIVIEPVPSPAAALAIALPELAASGNPAARVIELPAVPAGTGAEFLLPAGLVSLSLADGGRIAVVTLLRGAKEVAVLECRAGLLGRAVRIRPAAALAAGRYELRLALPARGANESARVWSYPLVVRDGPDTR